MQCVSGELLMDAITSVVTVPKLSLSVGLVGFLKKVGFSFRFGFFD